METKLSQLMEKHDLSKIKFSDGKYGYELKKNSSENAMRYNLQTKYWQFFFLQKRNNSSFIC